MLRTLEVKLLDPRFGDAVHRVIDIAGHMQKHAEPNTVAVARMVIEPLRNTEGFEPTTTVVDGYNVSLWKPNRSDLSAT